GSRASDACAGKLRHQGEIRPREAGGAAARAREARWLSARLAVARVRVRASGGIRVVVRPGRTTWGQRRGAAHVFDRAREAHVRLWQHAAGRVAEGKGRVRGANDDARDAD